MDGKNEVGGPLTEGVGWWWFSTSRERQTTLHKTELNGWRITALATSTSWRLMMMTIATTMIMMFIPFCRRFHWSTQCLWESTTTPCTAFGSTTYARWSQKLAMQLCHCLERKQFCT